VARQAAVNRPSVGSTPTTPANLMERYTRRGRGQTVNLSFIGLRAVRLLLSPPIYKDAGAVAYLRPQRVAELLVNSLTKKLDRFLVNLETIFYNTRRKAGGQRCLKRYGAFYLPIGQELTCQIRS
jgi:hypothetical protein